MKILVCNAGSTSLKFKLYQMPEEQVLAECRIERIADPNTCSSSIASVSPGSPRIKCAPTCSPRAAVISNYHQS